MISAPPHIPSYAQGFARGSAETDGRGLRDRLIGLWTPFAGPTGATLADQSGRRCDGALVNATLATAWTADRYGWALALDGTDDHANMHDGAGAVSVASGVLFALVKLDSSITGDGNPHSVFEVGSSAGLTDWIGLRKTTADEVMARYRVDSTNYDVSTPAAAFADTWKAIAIRWNSSGAVALFVDGLLIGSADRSATGDIGITLNQIRLGARGGTTAGLYCQGRIALAAAWARSLKYGEIRRISEDPFVLLRPRRRVWIRKPAVGGPYRAVVGQPFHAGAAAGNCFLTGRAAGQTFNTGQTAGQTDGRCG